MKLRHTERLCHLFWATLYMWVYVCVVQVTVRRMEFVLDLVNVTVRYCLLVLLRLCRPVNVQCLVISIDREIVTSTKKNSRILTNFPKLKKFVKILTKKFVKCPSES